MLKFILAVFVGSGLGGVCRYLLTDVVGRYLSPQSGLFWFTLVVNVVGCLLIGVLYGSIDRGIVLSAETKLLLTTGFCGGLTTFSTFAREGIDLFYSGQVMTALLYISMSVILGLVAAAGGLMLTKA